MTITPYGASAAATLRAQASFRDLKADLTRLQTQLSTGRKAETYGALGAGAASISLSARQRLAATEAYAANVEDGQLRIGLLETGITQLARLSQGLAGILPGSYQSTSIGQTRAQVSAEDGLRQALDILNTEVDGRYLYAGRASDIEPAEPYDVILNGGGGRAGLKQVVAERKAADLGPDGRGRLVLSATGTSVGLAEEAAGLPFGMKLASASATGSGITAGFGAGPPASVALAVIAQPAVGDAVTVGATLPDGSSATIRLTARDLGSPVTPGTYALGANATETAANLASALDDAVRMTAGTELAAASTVRSATDFFAGTSSSPPPRVAGPPFATATATVPGTSADTVVWYRGEAGTGSARETAPVLTGEGPAVAIGARANEPAFRALLAATGALAAESFSSTDPLAQGRYAALADRVAGVASGAGLDEVAGDMSVAKAALAGASERLAQTANQLTDVIAETENADPNQVAAELLATQTRLQASYQATAAIARMSLVEFL